MKKSIFFFKLTFIFTGIVSVIWFLIRVIPKPSRMNYPCMKATMPVASAFIMYILTLGGSILFFRKAINSFKTKKISYGIATLTIAVSCITWAFLSNNQKTYASSAPAQLFDDPLGPNVPIGEAKGIFPGRVIWMYNPDATNEDCTHEDNDDAYFLDINTDQTVVDEMFSDGIKLLTGKENFAEAWDTIFRYFNTNHGKGNVGYSNDETIFIKINAVTAYGGAGGTGNMPAGRSAEYDTSPQTILTLLRQLINEAGIPQANIFIGDPIDDIWNHIYNKLHTEFPNVNYTTTYNLPDRYQMTPSTDTGIYYSDKKSVMTDIDIHKFYQTMMDADYLINIPTMKGHRWGGVTFFAKNHFGSNTNGHSWELHKGLMKPDSDPLRSGYKKYRVQVDLMANKYLGGKTLLYFMDALWSTSYEHQSPQKFESEPFQNDWCSSLFLSLDPVAIESVCLDVLQKEFTEEDIIDGTVGPETDRFIFVQYNGVDDYLHQAASSEWWPAGITYDPDNSGTAIGSLGTHEHWNNTTSMQYSRNLGTGYGIELIHNLEIPNPIKTAVAQGTIYITPNPCSETAQINLKIGSALNGTIEIYSASGQKIISQKTGLLNAGSHRVDLNISGLESGIYICNLRTPDNQTCYTEKFVINQ